MQYILFFLSCLSFPLFGGLLDVEVKAKTAILMNGKSGKVLFDKKSHERSFPASTTKVATALFVLDSGLDLNQVATVSAESLRRRPLTDRDHLPAYWLDSDGTMMGLKRGEMLSLESLLHGIILVSGNDASNVIAETVGKTVPGFMFMLNKYLQDLGCKNTNFCNPHGLSYLEHYTTAHDLALIAKRALELPKFREVVSTLKYVKPETNKQPAIELRLSNALMKPKSKYYYPKAIGIKTGFTSASQHTLVAAAEQDGRVLVAVVLGCESSEDRYEDVTRLFERAFAQNKESRRLIGPENLFVKELAGSKLIVKAALGDDLIIDYFPAEEPKCKAAVHWEIPGLPIRKGQKVGEVHILDEEGNAFIQKGDLLASSDVRGSLFFRFKEGLLRLFSSE